MKKSVGLLAVCAVGAVSLSAFAVQVAGTLLVDLSAADVAGLGVGSKVQNWPNNGSLGLAFTNAVANQGPEFRRYGAANTPAVYFAASANSVLAGMPSDPRITGTGSWTLETWINMPSLASSSTYFSWTFRGASSDGGGGPGNRLFEARYSSDANAIEHYSGNLSWNNAKPPQDQWHHIVLTRDGSTRVEYVYVNGVQVQAATMANVNILPDGIFTIGATQNGARTGWEQLLSGYIGQIRVHTGFMPQYDAILNYMQERAAYGSTSSKFSVWDNPTASPAQPWEDPMNWDGVLPAPDSRTIIYNGGHAGLTTSAGRVLSLAVISGELTLSGNASLEQVVTSALPLHVANVVGATGTLNVVEGLLATRDNSVASHLPIGNAAGALGTVNVGGGALPARLEIGRDVYIGNALGATGRMTVWTNGTAELVGGTSGYIYVGLNGADGKLAVNGGTIAYQRIQLVNNGGKGVLELNDGLVRLTESLYFAGGTGYADAQAIACLNGGTLQLPRFSIGQTAGLNAVYFNGATVRNTASQTDATGFIGDTTNLYVQAGGAVFDVIAGTGTAVTEIAIRRPLKHDPALGAADGGLVKRGPGILHLAGTNTFTGDITLEDGMLFFSRNGNDLMPGWPGLIQFANSNAVVGCNFAGGIPWLLNHIPVSADGYLAVFPENANENIDLSNHPGIKLVFRGNVPYTGTLTLAQGQPLCISLANGAVLTYTQPITGTASLTVEGQGNGTLALGNSNTYTGGTTVRGGRIRLDNLAQLGAGSILLEGGALLLNQNTFAPSTALMAQIDTASRGYILLNSATTNQNFNLSAHPGIYIGTSEAALTYTGSITPNADTYRIGGGWMAFRITVNTGLSFQTLTDDTANGNAPRGVAIEGDGLVRLLNANTFSGPVAVTNKGGLFIGSGANQLGNTTSLLVNDGALRIDQNSVTIPSRVAVTAGPDSMEMHLWSSGNTTFAGTLSGSGRIWTSDAGGAFFADASAFTGTFDPCIAVSTLGVGAGTTFGWNPSIVITNSGTGVGYFGIQTDGTLAWSATTIRPLATYCPNIGLKKRGTGTLVMDTAQDYAYDTLVEQGTLAVAHNNALPRGTGRGLVGVAAGAMLDVNGRDITVNGIINPGRVTDSVGTARTLRAGEGGNNWTLTATIDPALTLVKVGAGTMTMNTPASVHNVTAEAGTVTLASPVGISGSLTLTGTSAAIVSGNLQSRLGALNGASGTRLTLNDSAAAEVEVPQGATATFSGNVTTTATSTLRKTGPGRQVIASPAGASFGYIGIQEGTLEITSPGNATAFVSSYLGSSNPDNNFTGITLSGLTGGGTGGVLLLADGSNLKMNRATTNLTFAGSIAGPAATAITKNDNFVQTLTGNNNAFHGTWIIHRGVIDVAAGGTLGDGPVINNGTLRFSGDEDYTAYLSTGTGTVVKCGSGTLYVRGTSNTSIKQSFAVEAGRVVFDTQGGTLYLGGTVTVAEGASWGVTGGGRVVIVDVNGIPVSQISVDGTEWFLQTSSVSPVQDGLAAALDASRLDTLTMDANNIVSQWASTSGAMIYTNPAAGSSPFYVPGAFGGRGGVLFGTNLLNNASTMTWLASSDQTIAKTVFIVNRLTGNQLDNAGIFGQSKADKGIRYVANSTSLRLSGTDGNDFSNNGGRCFVNGVDVGLSANYNVGTTPHLMMQQAGNNGTWANPISTSFGFYWWGSSYTRNWRGEIGELLVYNRILSDIERVAVENYLMGKWLSAQMPSANLPEALGVELSNGGVLNLNGTSQTVSTVINGAGGGSVVNGTLTITGALVVTVPPGGIVAPLAFDNVIFGPNAQLIVNGIENARGSIEVFTANTAAPVPPFGKANIPRGWTVSFRNGLCRLSRGATILILR